MAYAGLFCIAFIAATLLPAQSEALLAVLANSGNYSLVLLVVVATLGNVLGSCVNWWLGTRFETLKNKKWFPFSEQSLVRAQTHYRRYGRWTLLLSWVPIIGDPLTLIAGVMRERLLPFVVLVTVAKLGRYLLVVAAVSAVSSH